MTQNQKSVALSIFVVVALLVTMGLFVAQGQRAGAARDPSTPQGKAAPPADDEARPGALTTIEQRRHRLRMAAAQRKAREERLKGMKRQKPAGAPQAAGAPQQAGPSNLPQTEDSAEGRATFARTMGERFSSRGQPIKVAAVGADGKTFQFNFPGRSTKNRHIDSLKTAAPFHSELKGRGFEKLEIRVSNRTIWSKDLASGKATRRRARPATR